MDIEASHTDIPIDVPPWTIIVIRMAIRQIRSWKADGPKNIPVKALISDLEVTASILHVLLWEISKEEQVQSTLKEEYLIKMSREGDLSKYENHRDITLQSRTGSFSVLLNWMNDLPDAQISD
ncbi:unnamed protein product [Schistosoma curassoni]|uniref:RWD domain-containing protein n=1 Tax=Schistosoma curassoni TaxID=6186 RepID=A0A183JZ94_9TREM|nr:unnamed protein product [Schistosoma curassoni]